MGRRPIGSARWRLHIPRCAERLGSPGGRQPCASVDERSPREVRILFTERIRRHQLVAFFVLAYSISAVAFGVYIATPNLPFVPFWLVGIFSPTLAALAVAGLVGGSAEVGRLLSGFTRWRIGWRWYLASAVLMLGPLALAMGWMALGNTPPGFAPGVTAWFLAGQLAYTAISGPLAEEAGWRGFALPRLQARLGALSASIVLGTLWAFWHVPQYFLPTTTMIPFPIFVPQVIALAILFTWIYNNTCGSLVATVLAHFWFNFSGAFLAGWLGLLPPMLLYVGGGIMAAVLTVVVVVFAGPRCLSRRPVADLPFERRELSVPARVSDAVL